MGRVLSKILEQQTLTLLILQIAVLFPFVLKTNNKTDSR